MFSFLASSLLTMLTVSSVAAEQYPLTKNGNAPKIVPYQPGDTLPLECIARQIQTGEHKFDEEKNIIYTPFPKCRETQSPLALPYELDSEINCTIGFTDELYHLFQLYIHEDVPFSCRIPISSRLSDVKTGDMAYIPFTINIRGHIQDSHLDIDPTLNTIFHTFEDIDYPVAAIAYGAGTQTNRYVIGDWLPLQFIVRWAQTDTKSTESTVLKLPPISSTLLKTTTIIYCIMTMIISVIATICYFYLIVFPKRFSNDYTTAKSSLPLEFGYTKKD